MLPNWLYGKSKSKLASILGGGGGIPEDYNQVKAQVTQNAEDILLLSDALDDKAALTQITNPNLLINPWFTVNQRGFTTASSASGTYVADRWKVVSASDITITNGDGGITIDNTNGASYVTMETLLAPNVSKSLLGRELTMSLAKVIGVTDVWKTVTMPDSLPQSSTVIDTVATEEYTLRVVITGSGYVKVDVQVKEGHSVTIRAIKLEIGGVTTLARDSRPDMANELAKCQRYFQNIVNTDASNNRLIGIAYAVSTTSARILVTLPDHMRTNAPSFSKSGDFVLQPIAGGTAIDVTSVSSLGLMETYINIRADVASGLTAGSTYFFQAKPNAALNFSAEL